MQTCRVMLTDVEDQFCCIKRVYYSRMDETGLQVISQPYWVGVNTKFTI